MTPRPNIILLLVPARRYGVVGGQMLLVAEQNTGESASATGTAAGGACSSSRETCMSVPMHAAHDKNTQAAVYRRHVAFLRGNSSSAVSSTKEALPQRRWSFEALPQRRWSFVGGRLQPGYFCRVPHAVCVAEN